MTTPAPSPGPVKRSRRLYVLWGVALTLCLTAGCKPKTAQRPQEAQGRPGTVPAGQDASRLKAAKLVDQFLSQGDVRPITAAEKKKVVGLIKRLGVADYAEREAASRELVQLGRVALKQLRVATKSRDPEVAQRAKQAIAKIGKDPALKIGKELHKLGDASLAVIGERIDESLKALRAEPGAEGAKVALVRERLVHLCALNNASLGGSDIITKVVRPPAFKGPSGQADAAAVKGLVCVGAGEASDIKKGLIFVIERQDRYVAAIRVKVTRTHFSFGEVLDKASDIKKGDYACTKHARFRERPRPPSRYTPIHFR